MISAKVQRRVAVGPLIPGWGSWEWVGMSLVNGLAKRFQVSTFLPWETPACDAVIVIKHVPPRSWVSDVGARAAILYCPVDFYGASEDILADSDWLKQCAQIAVHCRSLIPFFEPFAPTAYLDHQLKFTAPLRKSFRADGPFLWVGVRTNLPPLITWVNAHPLPGILEVLTNPEHPGKVPSPIELGFRAVEDVRIHEWTADRHRAFTEDARAALDIKGDDFRSSHKPPAKGLDFIASGLPVAMNAGSSPAEHLKLMGLEVPSPLDQKRWLSKSYWEETRRLGRRLLKDLNAERVASRASRLVVEAIANWSHRRRIAIPVSDSSLKTPEMSVTSSQPVVIDPGNPTSPQVQKRPKLFGLMITKDDHSCFLDWCRDQLELYDTVVCLDGSFGEETARIATPFAPRLVYLREKDFEIPHKTNHGLRRIVHREIVRRFGPGHWIMCCHSDEFCYHDPRKIAKLAEQQGFDHVCWLTPHFFPHPDELDNWERQSQLSITDRFRYYHWDYLKSGLPWAEDRLYLDGPGVEWDDQTHSNVRPHGLSRPAPFRPLLRHYRVPEIDPAVFENHGEAAYFRSRWAGLPHRTGVPFGVHCMQDLFVRSIPKYSRCERFDGRFLQSWNMGDEFRPPQPHPHIENPEQQYQDAKKLGAQGESTLAIPILEKLDVPEIANTIRALARNDLAAFAAIRGELEHARAGFLAALQLDQECSSARRNLATLGISPHYVHDSKQEGISRLIEPSVSVKPVRVAILSLLFNWPSTGGGTVHTAELAKFLADAGYDVHHFYARYDPWGVGRVIGNTPYPADPIVFNDGQWSAEAIVQRFRTAVDEYDPDYVIISDSWNSKPLLAEAVQSRKFILRLQALECLCPLNNVRLLIGSDGHPVQCPTHQLARPDVCARCVRANEKSSGELHRVERALSGVGSPEYPKRLLDAFQNAMAVLVVNPLTEAMVSPYAKQVRVVTAGMDPARFPWPPPKHDLPSRSSERRQLLFAGLAGEWMKGFHVIHAACARLWQSRQDFELIVTDERPADQLPDAFTRYVGWQSQSDLPRFLWAADILVMPTVAQEALGRTAVEAMAAGRPVVASRLGGLIFTVADGATGLLFEPGDVDDLVRKLAVLLDDSELCTRFGTAGRKRFEDQYSWPVIIERHYRPLLLPVHSLVRK